MRFTFGIIALLCLTPICVSAQAGPPGWSAGAGLVVSKPAYRGSDTRIIPVPAVRYESARFYLLGLEAGVHLAGNEQWRTDVFLSGRLDGADDIDVIGLANRIERDDSLDLGARVTWRSGPMEVAATLKRDVLGVSDGSELGLKVSRVFSAGQTFLVPSLGVRWLDSAMTGYYFGTFGNEVAAGAPAYRPGSAAIAELGVTLLRPVQGTRWALFSQLTVGRLPGALADSPLVDTDTLGSFIAGATYQF